MRNALRRFFPHRWGSAAVLYVFLLFLVIGIAVHRDYGVSADEPAMRKFGMDAFTHLFHGGPVPVQLDWSFFNPAIPVFLRGIERTFDMTDGAEIWFMRHLVTFLMFFFTVVAFYHIARLRFRDWRMPLLGSVMFIVSPRLFAHGFYNPKDAPALFFFTISAWTLLLFLERRDWWSLVIHILFTAFLISMRVFGLLIPIFALVFLWNDRGRPTLKWSAAYVVGLMMMLIVVWPLLWSNPLNIIGAFINTTSRSGGGFYFGQSFSEAGVPWHYLPIWIGITTPVLYSLFFLLGFIALWIHFIRHPFRFLREKHVSALALLWPTLPVAALMILPIGIFDEWRHMLFLYPAFLLVALEGVAWMQSVMKRRRIGLAWLAPTLIGLQLLSTSIWMIRTHPFEYAYFSIPTRFIEGRFDLDYWGLSYRAGLEWIVKNDTRNRINVFTVARAGKAAADTLPYDDWNRLYFVTPDRADYILDNFRGHEYGHVLPEERKAHAVTVDGLEILAVYKGPDLTRIFEPIIW